MSGQVLAVIGATGATGRRLVAAARAAGYRVRALVRRPGAWSDAEGVEVVPGDALDEAAVHRLVCGADAVVSLLGPVAGSPPDVCARSAAILVAAMRRHGVSRLVVQTGAMIGHPALGPFYRWMVRRLERDPAQARALADRREAERIVRAAGLAVTIVRPPRLTNRRPWGGVTVDPALAIRALDACARDDLAEVHLRALAGAWVGAEVTAVSHLGGERPGRLYWGWAWRTAVAELVGIGLAAAVAVGWTTELGEPATPLAAWAFYAAMLACGAIEGWLLGALPGGVLARVVPGLSRRAFVRNTALVAVGGWALGMLPSTLAVGAPATAAVPPATLSIIAMSAAAGLGGGAVIGLAQWLALRRARPRSASWIAATAVAWMLGLSLDMLGAVVPGPATSAAAVIALGAAFGVLAGLVAAVPTGWLVVRWARAPRGAAA